jgi:hypothetical protein
MARSTERRRQHGPPTFLPKQFHVQNLFDALNGVTDRRLGFVNPFCCRRKATFLDDGYQGTPLVQADTGIHHIDISD